jgi:hypothetical protein
LEPPRPFLELSTRPNKGFVQGDQEIDGHSDRAPEFFCGDLRTFQKDKGSEYFPNALYIINIHSPTYLFGQGCTFFYTPAFWI